ncbi:MAG TPA: hypothetical protein VHZ53_11140 [Steroidobacteraceae bacterium]|nr:hypothetical protein [Steroidobacteraceae bacterium]
MMRRLLNRCRRASTATRASIAGGLFVALLLRAMIPADGYQLFPRYTGASA